MANQVSDHVAGSTGVSLHARVLCALRGAIKVLEPPNDYEGDNTFVDLFGAVLGTQDSDSQGEQAHLPQLATNWISMVKELCDLTIDALVVPKSGNIILADRVSQALGLPLVVVKSFSGSENSWISEGDPNHPTMSPVNFEGLTEFIANKDRDHPKFRLVLFDDSCHTGSSLKEAGDRIGLLAASFPDRYPIEVVTDAIVLFRRTTDDDALGEALSLHALLPVGNDELTELNRMPHGTDASTFEEFAHELVRSSRFRWMSTSQQLLQSTLQGPGAVLSDEGA